MTETTRLDASLKRLAAAIDHLEAAWGRRAAAERQRHDLEETLAVMQDDRSRLAVELDGALAKARALHEANVEVGRRLETVGTAIRTVLSATVSDGEN
jgi:chromosome segregation ATPase